MKTIERCIRQRPNGRYLVEVRYGGIRKAKQTFDTLEEAREFRTKYEELRPAYVGEKRAANGRVKRKKTKGYSVGFYAEDELKDRAGIKQAIKEARKNASTTEIDGKTYKVLTLPDGPHVPTVWDFQKARQA